MAASVAEDFDEEVGAAVDDFGLVAEVGGAVDHAKDLHDADDAVEVAELFLQEAHVAVTPGIAFGAAGEGHVRLSFATSDDALAQAVERIGGVLGLDEA